MNVENIKRIFRIIISAPRNIVMDVNDVTVVKMDYQI